MECTIRNLEAAFGAHEHLLYDANIWTTIYEILLRTEDSGVQRPV